MAEISGSQAGGLFIKEIRSKRDLSDYLPRLTDEEFQTLAHYMAIGDGERGNQFRAHNFVATTPAGILAELRMAQFRPKKRSNGRTVYHFVLSRRGRTDPEVLMAMGERLTRMLGLDKQRTLMAIHNDTANTHLHIAVDARDADGNTVCINNGYTHLALEQANAQLCFEHGLTAEAGIDFYANNEGIFRNDGHQVRDAQFELITRDAKRLTSAKTKSARLQEAETGRESIQAATAQIFSSALNEAKTLTDLIINLTVENVDYQLERSGATMTTNGVKIRASHISPKASPSKLAEHFGLVFLTPKLAQNLKLPATSGFFTRDNQGNLIPYDLPTKRFRDEIYLSDLKGKPAQEARQETEDLQKLPPHDPQHSEALRQAIECRQQKLQHQLEAEEAEMTKWQIDRLWEALRRMKNKTRGRPSRRMANNGDNLPLIPSNGTDGVLMSARSNSVWWVDAWAPGDSIKSHSGIKTVYRRKQVVATFSPTLITFYKATDDDLRNMLKLAKKKWGDDLEIYGDAAFRRKLTRIAAEENIVVANPELAPFQRYLLWPMQRALKAPASRLDKAFDAVLARAAGEFAIISNRVGSAAARSFELNGNALQNLYSRLADQGPLLMTRIADREADERRIAALQAQAVERGKLARLQAERIIQEQAAERRRIAAEQTAIRQRVAAEQARAEQQQRASELAKFNATLLALSAASTRHDVANRSVANTIPERKDAEICRTAEQAQDVAPEVGAIPEGADSDLREIADHADRQRIAAPKAAESDRVLQSHVVDGSQITSNPKPVASNSKRLEAPPQPPIPPSVRQLPPAPKTPKSSSVLPSAQRLMASERPTDLIGAPAQQAPSTENIRQKSLNALVEMIDKREAGGDLINGHLHVWHFTKGLLKPVRVLPGEVALLERKFDESAQWLEDIATAFRTRRLWLVEGEAIRTKDEQSLRMAEDAVRLWQNTVLRNIMMLAATQGEEEREEERRKRKAQDEVDNPAVSASPIPRITETTLELPELIRASDSGPVSAEHAKPAALPQRLPLGMPLPGFDGGFGR